MKFDVRIAKVLDAWSNLRPAKSFAGLTLDEFKAALKASLDAREAVTAAETSYTAAIVKRDNADLAARQLLTRVIAGVIADKDEGDNGELYKAMGYVRRAERNSGLTRRQEEREVPQPLAA